MYFAVTHFDAAGHRRKARVLAKGWGDAIDQMEQVYGVARGGSCLKMKTRPVLCVPVPVQRAPAPRA
ncbi:MAG: hypothetical protein WC829_15745 [Hyphomicrobium sp.]|jgi:hypothetical protein